MNQNIVFTGVGTYHPANEVDNSFFIEHFRKKDIEVESLLNVLGRKKRFLDNTGEETVITMAHKASKIALENSNTHPDEIDLLIFATDSPEYLCPSNAVFLHSELNTKNANFVFDINTSCSGMVTAFDLACKLLKENPRFKKALVVGSLLSSLVVSKIDPVVYSVFGDSGAAVVLEKVNENDKRGYMDSNFKVDSFCKSNFLMPYCGFSKMYDPDTDIEDKKLRLIPFDMSFIPDKWVALINEMLERNNLNINDINHFIFSQFSRQDITETLKKFDKLNDDLYTFVADIYGYTGVTSPFMTLNYALKNNRVKAGDKIIICCVGAGYNIGCILYQL